MSVGMEIWLNIHSREGAARAPLMEGSVRIGRGETADLRVQGAGVSRLHASIHREEDRVWILDEGSANGVTVNNRAVSPQGAPLSDRDVIRLGEEVTITIELRRATQSGDHPERAAIGAADGGSTSPGAISANGGSPGLPRLALAAAALLGIVLLAGITALVVRQIGHGGIEDPSPTPIVSTESPEIPTPAATPPIELTGTPVPGETLVSVGGLPSSGAGGPIEPDGRGLAEVRYARMTPEQQYDFLDREARRVTLLIGNREYVFEREVLEYIKEYVDGYQKRVGNRRTRLWGEDLNFIFERARSKAPYIIASFRKESVPVVLGLYIPMIETEYNECLRSPVGALGLFQFMPATASGYGVSPDDRCKVEKMAPAAARYMRDRIREFGTDGTSVALGIAAYNRSPQSVRRDLQDVLDNLNNERSFWTLLAKKEELDKYFRNENVKYVPKFFAATIVGENPEAFGLAMRKLSTYDQP